MQDPLPSLRRHSPPRRPPPSVPRAPITFLDQRKTDAQLVPQPEPRPDGPNWRPPQPAQLVPQPEPLGWWENDPGLIPEPLPNWQSIGTQAMPGLARAPTRIWHLGPRPGGSSGGGWPGTDGSNWSPQWRPPQPAQRLPPPEPGTRGLKRRPLNPEFFPSRNQGNQSGFDWDPSIGGPLDPWSKTWNTGRGVIRRDPWVFR